MTDRHQMNTLDRFREMMRERRAYPRGSVEHEWRSRAARRYWWTLIGVPPCEWENLDAQN